MAGDGTQRLRILEVILELRFVARLAGHHTALDDALGAGDLAHPPTNERVFRHLFRQNVARALQGGLHGGHFRRLAVDFWQQIRRRRRQCGAIIKRATPQSFRQRFKSAFARNHGARATLGLERQVEIFKGLLGIHRENRRLERVVQFALFVNALQHRGATIFEFVQIFGALTHIAQLHLVETAGHLLAVARDERQGGTLGEEGEGALNLLWIQREFRRNARDDGGSNRIGHVRGFYASGEPNSTPCVFRTPCAAVPDAHERGRRGGGCHGGRCPLRQLQPATALSQSTRHPVFPRDNTAAPRATPSSRPNNRRTSGAPTFRKASRGSATTSSSS